MITFEEARGLVGGKTLPHGWEDARDFVVLPERPEEDLTTMVNKRTRRVHKEVALRVMDRLDKMTRVTASPKNPLP